MIQMKIPTVVKDVIKSWADYPRVKRSFGVNMRENMNSGLPNPCKSWVCPHPITQSSDSGRESRIAEAFRKPAN